MAVITQLRVHTHCNDLEGKVWNPAIKWTKKYAVFITVESDQGILGLGECWCFDSAPDVLVAYIKIEIAPLVIGATPDECDAIYTTLLSKATLTARHGLLASAWSGMDIALWDLRSQEAKLPLWKFLQSRTPKALQNTKSDAAVKLYASGGLYGANKSTDDLIDEMKSMNSSGFDIVKMKIGGLSVAQDLERIHAVLAAIKPSCKLIIDGVYSYTEAQALNIYQALPSDRIEAFQSPLSADNAEGMKALCDAGVPVMATEAEYRVEMHQRLIHTGAVKFLQTAPVACGGISRLLQLSALVAEQSPNEQALSLEVSSTAVALMASVHFAASSSEVAHVEFHYLHQVFFDHLKLKPVPDRIGYFQLPATPGLGIVLPESDTHTHSL